jgi:hypothetical protein
MNFFKYDVDRIQEAVWAGIVALTVYVPTAIGTQEPGDWRVWGLALLGGAVRVFLGAAFSAFGSKGE